ncbi:SMR family transporter [Vibrio sp. Isolate31]|uniref:DMT family transporter n=1 Tax=unclassified Vibrio TaxID=2614977 RepID=UPI001EFE2295|nr:MULTISPECIES: SMR family transporter [unclassified Vibrio]MCG9554657.1 SMR family transporter [Vibrio sp. Isolate32]MCG9603435.1 SMR family transporter [Vibrio sp. Isolate31]
MLLSLPPPVLLSLAIVLEVIATSLLPKTQQFTSLPETAAVLAGYGFAFYLLSLTVKTISLGVAYAIWCGAGIVLVAALSWLVYGKKLDIYAVIGITLILAGVVIINLFSSSVSH